MRRRNPKKDQVSLNRSQHWQRNAAVLSAAAAVFACGKSETPDRAPVPTREAPAKQGSGKEFGSGESGSRQPKPAAAAFADLTPVLVEKSGLLPIGYFSVSIAGVWRHCMGSYVGSGRFVTAAHCFVGLEAAQPCPPELRIRWLVFDQGSYNPGEDAAACVSLRRRNVDGSEGADIAVLALAKVGTWPSDPLMLDATDGVLNKTVKMVGPVGKEATLVVRARAGAIIDSRGNYIVTNIVNDAGFSGAPVFVDSPNGAPVTAASKAIGLHVGALSNASGVLKANFVRQFLNETAK